MSSTTARGSSATPDAPAQYTRSTRWTGAVLLALCCGCSDPTPSAPQQVEQGNRYLQAGDVWRAIAAYRMALHHDSLDAPALGGLARAYRAAGRHAAAAAYAERAADLTYQRGLADVCVARGDGTRAIGYLEESARSNPDFADTHLRLGALYQASGCLDEASQAYRRAIAASINATAAYIGLGQIALRQQDWTQAAESFRTALLIQPDSQAARSGLKTAEQRL